MLLLRLGIQLASGTPAAVHIPVVTSASGSASGVVEIHAVLELVG